MVIRPAPIVPVNANTHATLRLNGHLGAQLWVGETRPTPTYPGRYYVDDHDEGDWD